MNVPRPTLAGAAALVLFGISACGQAGSSGTATGRDTASGTTSDLAVCQPVAGEQLVVLEDDLNLQTVDNIIPAIHAESAEPAMIAALDAVSTVLDTSTLVDLNKG